MYVWTMMSLLHYKAVPLWTDLPADRIRCYEIDIFIPMAPYYPAVDLISRFGSLVIACQVHISETHLNVLPLLQSHVEKAQWENNGIRTIILVYLSPEVDTTRNLRKRHESSSITASGSPSSTCSSIMHVPLYYTNHDFNRLKSIPWRRREKDENSWTLPPTMS